MDEFIGATLGPAAQARYQIILAEPKVVAKAVNDGLGDVQTFRAENDDAYFFNWLLSIDFQFQQTFEATHENMAALELHRDQPAHRLAVNLRRAFSGVVAGNVRESGIRQVEENGPFELHGEPALIKSLDLLLRNFVSQRRMRLSDPALYRPCYRIMS